MRKNRKAQVHILEVIIVAGMLFTALYFVRGLSTSTYTSVYEPNLLKTRADTALSTLDNDPHDIYHTKLTKLIVTNDARNFSSSIIGAIRPCYGYSVYVYNITNMYRNSSVNLEGNKNTFINQWAPKVGDKTQTSRLIVYDGYVYEVVLELWYL